MSTMNKTKSNGKAAFDKGWAAFERLGGPVNKLSNKLGCEAFCPMPLDQECDKTARILKSFCEDGFYTEQTSTSPSASGPKIKPKVLVKIPRTVIENCVGLAIFTVMRTGMWISGAGGSGVLIAKKEDGSWSPPSGLLVHTLGVGFMAGIDIYDCVVVINNRSALEAFSKVRVSLGGELSLVAGPLGVGGIVDSEVQKDRRPMFSYMKSRGLYAGAQLDGTVIVERNDENARFYGAAMPIGDILRGNVTRVPEPARMLMGVINDIARRAPADRQTPRMSEMPQSPDISTMSDEEIQKMDEAMAIRLQFDLPPQYEEHHSTSSLYELPSPVESHGPSGSSAIQISPVHGSSEESSLPPLPPRPSSSNVDNEKCKLG